MFLDGTLYLCTYDKYNDNNTGGSSSSDSPCDIFCEPFYPCFEIQGGAGTAKFEYQSFGTKIGR